jgi:hypothetical protein
VFTGAPSDISLDIANDRAAHDPMHRNAKPAHRVAFARWVHSKIRTIVPGIPKFNEDWTRCRVAGQMLDRYLLQDAAMKFMEDPNDKWSLTSGGYKVPQSES